MKGWRTSERPRILTAPATAPGVSDVTDAQGVKAHVAQRVTTHGRIAQSGPERLPYLQRPTYLRRHALAVTVLSLRAHRSARRASMLAETPSGRQAIGRGTVGMNLGIDHGSAS